MPTGFILIATPSGWRFLEIYVLPKTHFLSLDSQQETRSKFRQEKKNVQNNHPDRLIVEDEDRTLQNASDVSESFPGRSSSHRAQTSRERSMLGDRATHPEGGGRTSRRSPAAETLEMTFNIAPSQAECGRSRFAARRRRHSDDQRTVSN